LTASSTSSAAACRDDAPGDFAIGERRVGGDAPCFVIAEAAANHNRDLDVARALIDAAAEAGADAVKFQTYTGADLYSSRTPRFEYLNEDRPIQEILDAVALPREWQPLLAEHARERGILWFSSPFDRAAVDSLAELGVPALKIASFELVDLPLIRHAAATGIPLILSTGMATYGEIDDALSAVADAGGERVALLRFASLYPAPPEIINLRAMATLRDAFGVPVGLSDHTTGISVPAGGAALGMELIKKHFTLDRTMRGPDHRASLEPGELSAMVRLIREVESAMGDGVKRPTAAELANAAAARRSLHASRTLPPGHVLHQADLIALRPGTGLSPALRDRLVGRKLRVGLKRGEMLVEGHLD
jgi:sialic acid synthase SpsE